MTQEINESTFEAEVIDCDLPVLVDFFAPWCGPCAQQNPILEAWRAANEGKVKIVKLNVDEASGLASKYGVMNIPTLLLLKSGEEVARAIGLQNDAALDELLQKAEA
jgi:thioredoxin 1